MNVEIQEEWYSLEQCKNNPDKLYVFGDNTIRKGNGGQASIRNAINSIGIATKRLPSSNKHSYFEDNYEEYEIIAEDIEKVIVEYKVGEYKTLVLPQDGLGTGLSEMPQRAPDLFNWMNGVLSEVLNINYKPKI